jgi:vitamin B12 transporter
MYFREQELLVVSSTRHAKPVSLVAENISIITAQEIEDMNAHTVAEVLDRIPGLFVSYSREFGAPSLMLIQGSEERHVLVKVDGVPWNLMADGGAKTNSIPVGIIDRIEVIKGPASSAWGSSLGGIINILTKATGATERPEGSVSVSCGERNTRDYRAQFSGKAGLVGYYLYAGHKDSDGLRSSRYFDTDSLYAKFKIPVFEDGAVGISLGYSRPHTGVGDLPAANITSKGNIRTFFATTSFDASLTEDLYLNVSLYIFKQKARQRNNSLGLEFFSRPGELFLDNILDEETIGGSAKLVWKRNMHTAVLGMDVDRGSLDQRINAGKILRLRGAPKVSTSHPDEEQWAVYANDTIVIDRWSFTPGIRYDHNSITGSFTSPSLGVTYRLGKKTVVRASVSRGFAKPPLSFTSRGGLFTDPNRSLDPERVWSYQAGMESTAFRYFRIKATLFRHDLKKALSRKRVISRPPALNYKAVNKGKIRRQGLEIEVQTIPVYNFSFLGGFAYVHIKPASDSGASDVYSYNIGISYDDGKSLKAELFGCYLWWDLDSFFNAEYKDFIWDLNLTKKIYTKEKSFTEIFLSAHNLFNASQYSLGDNKNPRRWVEAGIRVKF